MSDEEIRESCTRGQKYFSDKRGEEDLELESREGSTAVRLHLLPWTSKRFETVRGAVPLRVFLVVAVHTGASDRRRLFCRLQTFEFDGRGARTFSEAQDSVAGFHFRGLKDYSW